MKLSGSNRIAVVMIGLWGWFFSGCGQADCPDCKCPDPCTTCQQTAPRLLTSEPTILSALQSGESVRIVLYYSRCLLEGSPGPTAIGGLSVDVFEWFDKDTIGNPKAYISLSATKLIFLGRYQYNYAKLRIYDDNTVEVIAEYVDPVTFKTNMHEQFDCKLAGASDSQEGVWVFADD